MFNQLSVSLLKCFDHFPMGTRWGVRVYRPSLPSLPSPPFPPLPSLPWKMRKGIFSYVESIFATFSPFGFFFWYALIPLVELFHQVGPLLLFAPCGWPFLACPPPPRTIIFADAHTCT